MRKKSYDYIENYFKIVKRTAQYGLDEAATADIYFQKWVAVWGLEVVGEVREVEKAGADIDHELTEIGDVLWSIAASFMILGGSQSELYKATPTCQSEDTLLGLACDYAEVAKKIARDGRKDYTEAKAILINLYSFIWISYPVDLCLKYVDNKLKKRYPNGYTPSASINREVSL